MEHVHHHCEEFPAKRVDGLVTQYGVMGARPRLPVVKCIQAMVSDMIEELLKQRASASTIKKGGVFTETIPHWETPDGNSEPVLGRVACAAAEFPKTGHRLTPTEKSGLIIAALNRLLGASTKSHIKESDRGCSIYEIHDMFDLQHSSIIHLHAELLEFEPRRRLRLIKWMGIHTKSGLLAVPDEIEYKETDEKGFYPQQRRIFRQPLLRLVGIPLPDPVRPFDKILDAIARKDERRRIISKVRNLHAH